MSEGKKIKVIKQKHDEIKEKRIEELKGKAEEFKERREEKRAEIKEKLPTITKEKEKNAPLAAPKKLKTLFTIVPRNKAEFYLDILEGYEVNMQMVLFGTGTLPKELAAAIHSNTDKAVIISVVKEEHVKAIMNAYEDKYFKLRNGQGIAFTIPFSSMIGKTSYQFLANMEGKGNE